MKMTVCDPLLTSISSAIQSVDAPLAPLELAVYTAIAYRDVFDFSPTAAEIHRYLPLIECSLEEVEEVLKPGGRLQRTLICSDGLYYALEGREHYFDIRQARKPRRSKIWPTVRICARIAATLPFVRMVALTGSIAADNVDEAADVDLLIVTRTAHMWRTKTFTALLHRLDRALRLYTFCPNFICTDSTLSLDIRGLYMAQELAQMVPLYGYDLYLEMMQANSWAASILPNAGVRPPPEDEYGPYSGFFKRSIERLTSNRLGAWYDDWLYRARTKRYEDPDHVVHDFTTFEREKTGLRIQFADQVERALLNCMECAQVEGSPLLES